MGYSRAKIIWSIVEVEWLKANKGLPVDQQCIALSKSRTAVRNKKLELDGKPVKKSKTNKIKIGKRKDLNGLFLRSGWEANFLRYLNFHKKELKIKRVEYEPTTFSFLNWYKKGTVCYTPDFKVVYEDGTYNWVEVKGQLKPQDKTKLRRFKKHYPEEFEGLIALTGSEKTVSFKFFDSIGIEIRWLYLTMKKQAEKDIPHWEK